MRRAPVLGTAAPPLIQPRLFAPRGAASACAVQALARQQRDRIASKLTLTLNLAFQPAARIT
jgi:hypothetical protein